MVHPLHQVNNRGWRRLPSADLEDFIRQSTADHRLSLGERQQLGRMEKRLAKMRARLRRQEAGI
jgi:hypothetical protein